jgi:carboxymethylenebutenolidase
MRIAAVRFPCEPLFIWDKRKDLAMSELRGNAPQAVGYEALPAGGRGHGVLLLHAWWGLNGVFRELCDRLAAEGFVVVAPDLWGGVTAATQDEAQQLVDNRDGEAIFHACSDALAYLRAHPAVTGEGLGAVGFSFGAAYALLLASTRPELRAVTIFYGTYPLDFSASQAAVLGHFAPGDPWEPDESVAELEQALAAAGREATFHRYPGAGHWFFEPDRPDAYDAAAAALAWERTVAFLRARLGA